ncbi:MAG TPA: hypothetical protein VGV64_02485 [Thermoplasmata archaeon]|nr:hypothetical protein [Thermoplasmata archaeon]HEV2428697.1 hypothetical protein [Thermoplasmata archaeon]
MTVGGMILGQVYHCLDCDYVGSLVVETDEPSPSEKTLPRSDP